MANKRRLKKVIKAACGDMAGNCIITRNHVAGADARKMDDIIFKIAELQCVTIDNVSFSFDKSEQSFESHKDYRKARKVYFRKAYGKLLADFNKGVAEIVDLMNAALPEAQKELNKAAANKQHGK